MPIRPSQNGTTNVTLRPSITGGAIQPELHFSVSLQQLPDGLPIRPTINTIHEWDGLAIRPAGLASLASAVTSLVTPNPLGSERGEFAEIR